MKWLDECPTSRQARQAGRQSQLPPSTGGVCVDRGRGWYWTTANKAAEPASRKQRDSAAAACLPAWLLLHLIDFRKWRKIVSKRQDKVSSGQSRNWNCTMPALRMCLCVCVCVWVWASDMYWFAEWKALSSPLFPTPSWVHFGCFKIQFGSGVWNLKMNMVQAIYAYMFVSMCTCVWVCVHAKQLN